MGKQTDAIKLLRKAFEDNINIDSIDLGYHETDINKLKITVNPVRGKALDAAIECSLEEQMYSVYSGQKQIEKLVLQRFTRSDFFD